MSITTNTHVDGVSVFPVPVVDLYIFFSGRLCVMLLNADCMSCIVVYIVVNDSKHLFLRDCVREDAGEDITCAALNDYTAMINLVEPFQIHVLLLWYYYYIIIVPTDERYPFRFAPKRREEYSPSEDLNTTPVTSLV